MKIILSQAELNVMVRRYYNLPDEATVTVEETELPLPDNCQSFIDKIKGMKPGPGNIIPPLKEIREWIHMGLGDAKWAAENFDKVEAWITKNRRLPVFLGRGTVGEMV
jgi:hypothetical protein